MKHFFYPSFPFAFLLAIILFVGVAIESAHGEELFFEDFDDCSLPSGWTVNLTGNAEAVWDVGISDNPEIENAGGEGSMDGTCFLYFDDDATGEGADPWNIQVTSPTIDATNIVGGGTVLLEADVHFRTWGENGWLKVLVSDGTQFQEVFSTSQGEFQGPTYGAYTKITLDISAYANANMQVRFEYDDGGVWAWWAGVDNVRITNNILAENFNDCALPNGWTSTIETGDFAWEFGTDTIWNYSMNGSCMAYFNDDKVGEFADPSRISLTSPSFDGTQNASVFLEVDAHILNYNVSSLSIGLMSAGNFSIIHSVAGIPGEWYPYSIYDEIMVDISAYRSTDMQVVFIYDDGSDWAWRAAIDNFKIWGEGESIDNCSDAVSLVVDGDCYVSANANAVMSGPVPACVDSTHHAVWFSFEAPASGNVSITTDANFNDVITLLEGSCNSLNTVSCRNKDEFGFTGETLRASGLNGGSTYLIRISGADCTFGLSEGDFCIQVTEGNTTPTRPSNDNCADAVTLTMDADCTNGNNTNATLATNELISSLDANARASIWYNFTAPSSGELLIKSGADFADVITVFEGNCSTMTEVATNDFGHSLNIRGLTGGQMYWIQITGYFATVEGNVCMQLQTPPNTPANDLCNNAISLAVDGVCQNYSNVNASINGDLVDLQVPFSYHSGYTSYGGTFVRPQEGTTCTPNWDEWEVGYDVLAFTVDASGNYLFETEFGNFDGFVSLYENNFDPNNPCANYINSNDDNTSAFNSLMMETLTAGTTYSLVFSSFGFWEGGAYDTEITGPGNPLLLVNDANLNGATTSCDIQPASAIWFKFTAPLSGNVKINTGADFVHVISIFAGGCGAFQEVMCSNNPSKCDGYMLVEELNPNEEYYLQIASANNPFGYNYGAVCIDIQEFTTAPIKIRAKALLQGAYTGNGNMSTLLSTNDRIPHEQPYNQAPWNYAGRECIDELPANMVDWVLLELRAANSDNLIVGQKAALLLDNGNIIDEGKDGVFFDNLIENESYYMVVRHRNHLAVMSAVPVPVPNSNHYLFTGGDAYILGGNAQVADSGDGYSLLYAGDMNADGVVTVMDFNQYAIDSSSINTYTNSDCNLDGNVTVADFNAYQPNASVIGVMQVRY